MSALRWDDTGRVVELVGVLRDISEAAAAEQQLRYSALHDDLTGLPNRALLMDRLEGALARTERTHRETAVLFCDLDGFKRVNDNGGHAAGDLVLAEVGRRLTAAVRDGDTVARIGGDEFVVVIEPWDRQAGDPVDAEQDRVAVADIAERIREAVRRPVLVDEVEYIVSVSIGVAFGRRTHPGPVGVLSADDLLRTADDAMYRAKKRGRDRFEVFQGSMRTDGAERSRAEKTLRQAVRSAQQGNGDEAAAAGPALTAAYQPIFSAATGALVGFEALARLVDAEGEPITPDVFIPIAEDTGLIGALDVCILNLACRQLAAWRAQTPEMNLISMAVNVSALHAQHATLTGDIHHALARHHLAAGDLVLELTETALLDAAHSTIAALRSLHEEGVGIAIDDFGTGYASLRYLATLPISTLKIDKSFTAGLPQDHTCRKIVNAVAGLAADLDLSCIVEGVETQAQRRALPDGVHLQGYLTGRPQHPDAIDLNIWFNN